MVEPETFMFLADLATNNRKAWMDVHREERDDALRNFSGIATTLHDYAHRFDHNVAEARIKPKQSYSKFFQEARDRVGPGLYRTDVDVFANAGNPAEDVGYNFILSLGIATQGLGFCSPQRERLPACAHVLSTIRKASTTSSPILNSKRRFQKELSHETLSTPFHLVLTITIQ
jgi:hypothetical protein